MSDGIAARTLLSERRLVGVVALVQFVNVLDFVMVMPLGPDFATALGIPTSQIGMIGGSYTLAAAVAGVVGSFFLDRFDRRSALGVTLFGLALATALGGLAQGMTSLVLARLLAGAFGGPATSLAIAALSDAVPPERRGRALGTVLAAFSVASVLGIPAGLELARLFTWRAPFLAVAILGVVVTGLAMVLLPKLPVARAAKESADAPKGPALLDRLALVSLCNTFVLMLGVFLVVPNISAYFQYNLGYPRERLGLLYLVGGALSFVTMRIVGGLVDRFGATRFVALGTLVHVFSLWTGFIDRSWGLPVMLVFVTFMLSGSIRMVPNSSVATRVPRAHQRASFMSAQSAVQHTGSALGAFASAVILVAAPNGHLLHMEWVAGLAALLALAVPVLVSRLERGVGERERSERAHAVLPPAL